MIETSRAHGRGILEGISHYVREKGHWKIYFEDRGVSEKIPNWFSSWKGDGIITRSKSKNMAKQIHAKGIPTVELLGDGNRFFSEVEGDCDILGQMAADYFWNNGFRNYAFFCPDNTFWSNARYEAFRKRLLEYGVDCEKFQFSEFEMKDYLLNAIIQGKKNFLEKWLVSLSKPLALLAAIDLHAVYILEACLNAKISVPEEIAILGCGNDKLHCSLFSPSLSSIELNSHRIGYEAAQLLDQKMRGKRIPELPIKIPPSGIAVRHSTDIIAIEDPDVALVLKIIRERFSEPIGIQQITESFGFSRRTMERRFQKHLGRSMENELKRIRLEQAKYLLRESNVPLFSIGPLVGINDPYYFMRLFRKEIGMTPKQYRNLNPVENNE